MATRRRQPFVTHGGGVPLKLFGTVAFGLLALIKTVDPLVMALGETGRFDKSSGQITVAVLGVVFAFHLAVVDPPAGHAASVRGKVTGFGEAMDVAGLEDDRQSKDIRDTARASPTPGMLESTGCSSRSLAFASTAFSISLI